MSDTGAPFFEMRMESETPEVRQVAQTLEINRPALEARLQRGRSFPQRVLLRASFHDVTPFPYGLHLKIAQRYPKVTFYFARYGIWFMGAYL